jgi:general secretion pathway protein G
MSFAFRKPRAFSLIELVIVVVIIGIIAAIAVPRMSRGAAGASDNATRSNLAMLRKAVELYAAEHNNSYPTIGNMPNSLLHASNVAGGLKTSAPTVPDASFPFGPYIRSIPNFGTANSFTGTVPATAGNGWYYDATTGNVLPNSNGNDTQGVAWSTY